MKVKIRKLENITGLSDVAFKTIMYQDENILRKVLSEVLDEKVGKIKYLNVELSVNRFLEKGRRLDLYLEDEQSFINIEVTNNYNITIVNRNVGNMAKLYTDTVSVGDDYDEYKEVKIINLIGKEKSEETKRMCYLRDQNGKILTKKLIYSEIYIQNLVDLWYNKDENEIQKYKHLIMLGLNLKELKKFNLEYGDEIVDKYTKDFSKLLDNMIFEPLFDKEEDERRIRNSYRKQALKEGEEKGIAKGICKGEKNKQIEIAKKMLEKGNSIEEIIELTELSREEISKL